MSEPSKFSAELNAAKHMDCQQVVLNGGPPCFHLPDDEKRFCGRAQRWEGHSDTKTEFPYHKFVSLADLLERHGRGESADVEADVRIADMRLWAWVGEDELGSKEFGIKQAIVPAGYIPIVACKQEKVDTTAIQLQLQHQARQYRKTISLVRFRFERVEKQVM